ncbi:MAG: tryptophan synthase subunit alpha [Planctomycetes bacterium]|nr:tryptophan synthase subunit alpha [Planctomycetota bacterium]
MKTYQDIFNSNSKPALIPFFVLGDPDAETCFELVRTAIDAGADCLELGIPFSDPIADGPTIQRANIRALAKGMNCDRAFEIIKRVKAYRDIPIGLLMYYNLITHYGVDNFYKAAAQAGVNSVLVADLCIDDADELTEAIQSNGLDTVFMVTPNTTQARQKQIAKLCSGFIYTVSLLGVTGARQTLNEQVKPLIQSLKNLTKTPVCVGFGISTPDHVRELIQAGADAVIIGSAIVDIVEKNIKNPNQATKELANFIKQMKNAL